MSDKFRPGPWLARMTREDELFAGDDPYWIVIDSDENANEGDALICSVNVLDEAYARLIAAAPELLVALQEAVEWDSHDSEGVPAVWLEKATAAIARATAAK